VLALLAATTLAMLVPAAPLVSAQPSDDDQIANPTPPPPDPNLHATDTGQPDGTYVRDPNTACVGSLQEATNLEEKPWGQRVLRVEEAQQYATGRGVTVAVIDTGVNEHAFLGGRLTQAPVDYVNNDAKTPPGGANPPDCDGHGTQVAGIIGANPNDPGNIGFIGVAPDATILSIRQSSDFYKNEKEETAGKLETLASAIVRATNTEGVGVINMSVDACRLSDTGEITSQEAMVQAALRDAVAKGIVPVVSAGNIYRDGACKDKQNSADPDHPSIIVAPPWFSDLVLSVAAVQKNGETAQFSIHGPWISVAAPGTEIISLDPVHGTGLVNQTSAKPGEEGAIQGTSFAAPYVAGLAALLKERFPNLTAEQIMHRIKATAQHPAGPGGRNLEVGYGMIDPVAALTEVIPGEENIKGDDPITLPSDVPPPYEPNWAPMQVALAGAGGGLVLLMLTLFIVHTVRRNKR
jgi:membrane-anchored mycosin MYCP